MEQVFLAPGPKQSDFDALSNAVSTLNTHITNLFKMVTAQTSLNITSNYTINDNMSVTIPNDYSVVSMCPVFVASDVIVIPIGISNSRLYYRLENKGGTAYGVKTVKINVLCMKD